jgi:hypothetical protein
MWVFICLLCAAGVFLTLTKLSLLERRGGVLLPAFVTALVGIVAIPWATRINMQGLTRFLNRLDVLNNLCTVLVIESIFMLLALAHLMKQHVAHGRISLTRICALAPSPACLVGVFLLLVFLCNSITGHSYLSIGCAYSLGVFVVLGSGSLLVRRLVTAWYARLEILLVLSFVQLILAMFLPLVARGLAVPTHASDHSLRALVLTVALSLGFAGLAFLIRTLYATLVGDQTP